MTDAKVIKLKTKRMVLVEQQNRVAEFVDAKAKNASLPELSLRLDSLIKLFESFTTVQSELEFLVEDEISKPDRASYEETYFKIRPLLQVRINAIEHESRGAHVQPEFKSNIKLPKIEINSFAGDFTKWLEFYESFNSLIHNNSSLNNVTKFQYLRNALSGDAARVIAALELKNENYEEALKLLRDRYQNVKLICNAHIFEIFAIKNIDRASAVKIRNIIDIVNTHLRSLKSLGRPTLQWDDLIIFFILTKLDHDTRMKWEDECSLDKMPTLDQLITSLERRCRALENNDQINKQNQYQSGSKSFSKNIILNKQKSTSLVVVHSENCVICDKSGHGLYRCEVFLSKPVTERLSLVSKYNLCTNCLTSKHKSSQCQSKFKCRICFKTHHTLLHSEATTSSSNVQFSTSQSTKNMTHSSSKPLNEPQSQGNSLIIKGISSYVFLMTASVKVRDCKNKPIIVRALLDSCSHFSFITEKLANRLGLPSQRSPTQIYGISNSVTASTLTMLINIESCIKPFSHQLKVHILNKITDPQPVLNVDISNWKIPQNILLADPNFNQSQEIDMLIGAELYCKLLSVGQIQLGESLPDLQNTVLGWVVSGSTSSKSNSRGFCNIITTNQDEVTKLNHIVQQFWDLEQINPIAASFTNEEQICETHFLENVCRADSGRFTVALPFFRSPKLLGNSRQGALIRFFNLEKRLSGNPELKSQYGQFIQDYRNLNHMRLESETNIPDRHYFLPHHCVLKPSSSTTKLRVVFDASAKTDSNKSLNDLLMVGPVVQSDLVSILLRFRRWKIAFSADISKMYRQINIRENDSHYQYIFWRDNPEDELQIYRLTTVTYGTASAPYLATRCLLQLCNEEAKSHPLASKVVQSDMYVDDLLTGSNSINEALHLQGEVVSLLATAGMNLKKWCSNSIELLSHIPDADKESFHVLNNENVIKTLGMFWQPEKDYFCYIVKVLPNPKRITKRLVLSETASIFDPLGLAGPVILVAKIFIQQLWKLKQDWDESLPQSMHTKWTDFRNQLACLNNFRVKRFIETYEFTTDVQLHGFGDSSEVAFGAAIYIRCNNHNHITTTLLCAKSRVAPLSKVTLPRLELCAALLTTQLMSKVRSQLNVKVNRIFYWTDSSIVWHWINSSSSHSKVFVANRIAEIHRLSNIEEWNHVASENNAADVISRGLMPAEFINCNLWLNGPEYLRQSECKWPKSLPDLCPILPEQRKVVCLVTTENDDVLLKHKYIQQFKSLQRSMAYVCRFVNNCRKPREERRFGELDVKELSEGHNLIIKSIQHHHFHSELISLSSQQSIPRNSPLKTLNPFIDKGGLLRVGGRLKNSELPYSSKFPLILPLNHKATLTIFNHYHYSYLHPGPQALLAMIKEKYWPIGGRKIARKVVNRCIRCFHSRPSNLTQFMGNLPAQRVSPAPPFSTVGIDMCGPFFVHFKGRFKAPVRTYIVVFVCFVIKAIHLELASDLSTNSFLGALKRFIATRGRCTTIFTDNATNFVGANKELRKIFDEFNKRQINRYCVDEGITWKFAPPRSPHFGGLYEAAVKTTKHHIRRIFANATLTYEEFLTAIKQIEAVVNSRPLTALSTNPDDLNAITPGHFLIGRQMMDLPETNNINENIPTTRRWQIVQQLFQHFWKRWSAEYLTELQQRRCWNQKSKNLEIGQLVLLKEDDLPPLKWKLGRIVAIHAGNDGYVRVVTIKTNAGEVKRAVVKVCPLPEPLFET